MLTLTFEGLWNNTLKVVTVAVEYSLSLLREGKSMGVDVKSGQICLSINGTSVDDVLRVAEQYGHDADVLEIRLDLLDNPEVDPFVSGLDVPLLFTNRPDWEGGQWGGSEDDRISLLLQAIEAGASYVDIELQAPDKSFQRITDATKGCDCLTITSWHNFIDTPGQHVLVGLVEKMAASGADIGKVVTTACDHTDTLRVLALQLTAAELGFPLACFSMGKAGQVSRVATLSLGGVLTYGASDSESCTAPGQLTVAELRTVQEIVG